MKDLYRLASRSVFVVALCAAPLIIGACAAATPVQPAPPAAVSEEAPPAVSAVITWKPLSAAVVEDAQANEQLILLYVGTTWCHWCHVMDDETWAKPEVARYVNKHFITIRVDADADPAILERYEAWGWPATIIIGPDGQDRARFKGYMDAKKTVAALAQVVAAPLDSPRLERAPLATLDDGGTGEAFAKETLASVMERLDGFYRPEEGGWGGPKKYPLMAPMRLGLWRAQRRGEAVWAERTAFTLQQLLNITDPVWGGMYQYSTRYDWVHPHTEKLALIQGRALMMFADVFAATGDARYARAGVATMTYVRDHLRDAGGGFYANQDADAVSPSGEHMLGPAYYALDDAARRAFGYPRVDKHVFATHTAYIIRGLATFAMATQNQDALQLAADALSALDASHKTASGYAHEAGQDALYLADQVQVGRAALALYEATLDDGNLERAHFCAAAILAMRAPSGDFYADDGRDSAKAALFGARRRPFDASAEAAHFLFRMSLLSDSDKTDAYRHAAEAAARALAQPERIAREGRGIGPYALLLADMVVEPLHIALGGPKAERAELVAHAQQMHVPGRFIEKVNPGGRFGQWDQAVAFVCGASSCSAPVFDTTKLESVVQSFIAPPR